MTLTTNPCSDRLDDMKREVTAHLHRRWSDLVSGEGTGAGFIADYAAYFIVQLDAGLV